jgi:hypothetical protein
LVRLVDSSQFQKNVLINAVISKKKKFVISLASVASFLEFSVFMRVKLDASGCILGLKRCKRMQPMMQPMQTDATALASKKISIHAD